MVTDNPFSWEAIRHAIRQAQTHWPRRKVVKVERTDETCQRLTLQCGHTVLRYRKSEIKTARCISCMLESAALKLPRGAELIKQMFTGVFCKECQGKDGHFQSCSKYTIDNHLNSALHSALHSTQGAEDRWKLLATTGATDAELLAAIRQEFGISGGSHKYGGYKYKGGKNPELSLPDYSRGSTLVRLSGKTLLDKARTVIGVGQPKVSRVKRTSAKRK